MSKVYFMQFGSGDPRTYTGLAPTFLIFVRGTDGQTISPPSITESLTSSGIYQFTFGTTQPIAFLADAATTSPGTSGRYVFGAIDPADRADEYGTSIVALGTTAVALGITSVAYGVVNGVFGSVCSAQGNTAVALGNTAVALGTTAVALGTTSVAWGSAIGSALVATGSTLVAIGNSAIALGTSQIAQGVSLSALGVTILAAETNQGTTLVAIGNTSIAISSSIAAQNLTLTVVVAGVGSTTSSFGTSSADPVDLFGYLKRILENLEGDNTFAKTTGVLTIADRTNATTLRTKTITNNASLVTKL